MRGRIGLLFVLALSCPALTAYAGAQQRDSTLSLRLISDEADAVLAIIAQKQSHQRVFDQQWRALFSSEGYLRLKKREAGFHAALTDSAFGAFVLSDSIVARSSALRATLEGWKRADFSGAARRALAYLPMGARIKATIYPVIKPRSNSFVYEPTTNPAIFLFLNPAVSPEKFENTIAHELHHIGYANSCGAQADAISGDTTLPEGLRMVLQWIGSFGEGFAMLAAAGGPDIHPHAVSSPADRARWDRDVANFNADLRMVDRFFLDILHGRLSSGEIDETGSGFYGQQGPWYTVGWKMAVTIEKVFGRSRLIACMCDPRELPVLYNKAAVRHNIAEGDTLQTWSTELVERLTQITTQRR